MGKCKKPYEKVGRAIRGCEGLGANSDVLGSGRRIALSGSFRLRLCPSQPGCRSSVRYRDVVTMRIAESRFAPPIGAGSRYVGRRIQS
jgi:hypothetical protein